MAKLQDEKMKYILTIDENNNNYIDLSKINDGENKKVLQMNDNFISKENLNFNENQKFMFQFIPEENYYRIICVNHYTSLG